MDGELVGSISTDKSDPQNGTFSYGVSIFRVYWKKGYASDAIKIVLRYFFHELRYQKVNAHVYSFNEGSKRLHEQLGFTKEGCLRNMIYTNDKYFIDLYECKGEQPYADAIEKVPNTIEYRLFHSDRKIVKESTETSLEEVMLALSLDSVTIENNTYKRLSLEFDEDRKVYVYYLNG